MLARFNTSRTLQTEPDNASYQVFDEQGRIVAQSETHEITAVQVAAGTQITINYDVPDLGPGNYQVVFTIDDAEFNVPLNVEGHEREANGYITIDRMLRDVPMPVDAGTWTYYHRNTVMAEGSFTDGTMTAEDLILPVSMESGMILVRDPTGAILDIEVFSLNPVLLKAVRELRSMVDRLQLQLRLDALEFEDIDYVRALVRGRGRFNGIPLPTDISMHQAEGPIRSNWLMLSQIEVLRVRLLEEGLTNYDYQGSGVNLSVTSRDAIQGQLDMLEMRADNEVTRLKKDMHERGQITGDGQWSVLKRVAGAVGLSHGFASGIGRTHLIDRIPRSR